VSSYGVTDLFDLARTTHRFESRYLDEIVGVLPADTATYRDRSPVTHAAAITVPLLVLQGDADLVVPPAQAQLLVDAVRSGGGTVEHHVYEGEGHGWSRRDTVQDDLERTHAFLERWVVNA
jgi:dipeptidyl aminopeptidase/acylaminoacyl peptidase